MTRFLLPQTGFQNVALKELKDSQAIITSPGTISSDTTQSSGNGCRE